MIYKKEDALQRCAKYHDINGRIYGMLKGVLNAVHPIGTNLVLKFVDACVKAGLPYVATNMQIDTGADCAEFWRVVFFIFFGKDIGVWTVSQWGNKEGIHFSDKNQLRVLDMIYFNFDEKVVSHTAGYVGNGQMVHTTQVKNTNFDLRYDPITKYKSIKGYVRFITDAELASVTVGGTIIEEGDIMLKKNDKGKGVYLYQHACLKAGFNPLKSGKKWKDMETGVVNGCDGSFGAHMETVTKQVQSKYGLPQTGTVDAITYGCLVSGIKPDTSGELVNQMKSAFVVINGEAKKFI